MAVLTFQRFELDVVNTEYSIRSEHFKQSFTRNCSTYQVQIFSNTLNECTTIHEIPIKPEFQKRKSKSSDFIVKMALAQRTRSEANREAQGSNFSFFLWLLLYLFHHFFMKTEHEARVRSIFDLFFLINQSKYLL